MDIQERNGCKIYSLTCGTTLPPWITEQSRRNLQNRDPTLRHRLQLLQDFTMPVASHKLHQSPDGNYIAVLGTYPPRVRMYDVQNLSLKFERYLDFEPVDLVFLGEDYGKFAVVLGDRSVVFHAPYGHHDTIRLPGFGRGLEYDPVHCNLLIPSLVVEKGSGREDGVVYRFDLEGGKFLEPLVTSTKGGGAGGVNCAAVSPTHDLVTAGDASGFLHCFDTRAATTSPFQTVNIASHTANYGFHEAATNNTYTTRSPHELTALSLDQSGLYLAAGTHGGCVPLYDLRRQEPLMVKEHQYGTPIHTLAFTTVESGLCVASGDSRLVKIWRAKGSGSASGTEMGSIVTNIESPRDAGDFNHFILCQKDAAQIQQSHGNEHSGLVLCATEQPDLQSYYVPALGAAPKWCSFLDSITEELEETQATDVSNAANPFQTGGVYNDYKFVTRAQVTTLGLDSIIGTPLLRAYMHGYFIHVGLYNKVSTLQNPMEYQEYRKKKIREKLDKKSASRISPHGGHQNKKRDKNAVNASLKDRLIDKAQISSSNSKAQKTKIKEATNMLTDDRFASLFSDKDYEIDEDNLDFKLRNPSGLPGAKHHGKGNDDEDMDSDREGSDSEDSGTGESEVEDEGFTKVEAWDSNEDEGDDDDEEESSDEEDGFRGVKVRGELYDEERQINKQQEQPTKQKTKKTKQTKKKMVMYEANDDYDPDATTTHDRTNKANARRHTRNLSLAERLANPGMSGTNKTDTSARTGDIQRGYTRGEGTTKEMTYIPKSSSRKMNNNDSSFDSGNQERPPQSKRVRRGVKELKLRK